MAPSMKLRIHGSTDVGRQRDHNEDTYLIDRREELVAVFDGLGGHAHGEVASKICKETVREFFRLTADNREITWPSPIVKEYGYDTNRLRAAIEAANRRVWQEADKIPEYAGMGSTVVALVLRPDEIGVCHVGDSRVYRWRAGELEQLTEDHSLLNDYRRMLNLSEEETRNFPHRNIIVRALGMNPRVQVDVRTEEPVAGDLYLLCSDGLTDEVPDEDIGAILHETFDAGASLPEVAHALIDEANARGGRDNITVALAHILEV